MKILMINKFLYPRGGAETYMLKLGEYFSRAGHQVEYFGMYDEKNTVGNSAGMYTSNMDFHGGGAERFLYPFKIIYSFEAKSKLGRVLDEFRPDVVHMNNINFQLTPSVIDAVKERGIPLVQTVHDYQMICPNHLLYNLEEGAVCERCIQGSKWNCAKYKCIHGSRVKSIIGSIEACLYRARRTYEKVDRYICPSRFLADILTGSEIYRGKTEVIHNFIELPDMAELAGADERIEKGDYVVFAGRLSREKGVEIIAEAARLMPDAVFMVAGSGELEYALRGLDNVKLTGFLTGAELQRLVAGARVAILPSVWYENCPLSILEANSLGTPVVTVNAGGMAELVENGVTGRFVNGLSGAGLAETLRAVLADTEALERMSENCIEHRKDMITLDKYCERVLDIYNSLQRESVPVTV